MLRLRITRDTANTKATATPRLRLVEPETTAAFGPFDEAKHPRVQRGQKGGGRFTIKENAAGRYEIVDQDTGKKVGEMTDPGDAAQIRDEKNANTLPEPRLAHERSQANYYSTREEANAIRDSIMDEHPDARVVEYDRGFAVQQERSGAYVYTPPAPAPVEGPLDTISPDQARSGDLALHSDDALLDAYSGQSRGPLSPEARRRVGNELGKRGVAVRTRGYETAVQDELARSGSYRVNAQVPEGVSLPDPGEAPYSSTIIPLGGYGSAHVVRGESGNLALQWGNQRQHEIWKALPSTEQTRIMNDAIARKIDTTAAVGESSDPEMETIDAVIEDDGQPVGFIIGSDPEMEALVAAIPVNPPADWFFMDEPDELTPLTVTADGLVYGHAAGWGSCHLGNPRGAGVCVQPPASQTDYALFHLGELQADGGEKISVGQITLDTGHAPMGASARTAAAHYDDTGASVVDVRARNGEHGIFFAGALRPDVTPTQLRKLTASKISGDWRGGELVGMLCVNVPGFPVPRTQARLVASVGEVETVMALVAAGIVGEQRTVADVSMDIYLLASAAEGIDPVDALVALAEDGIVPDPTDVLTAAIEIERIKVRITDAEAREMPELSAALEQETALQVDFFRDHGYWPAESLSGGAFTPEELQNAQTAGALLVIDPLQGASMDLRNRLLSRGLLV